MFYTQRQAKISFKQYIQNYCYLDTTYVDTWLYSCTTSTHWAFFCSVCVNCITTSAHLIRSTIHHKTSKGESYLIGSTHTYSIQDLTEVAGGMGQTRYLKKWNFPQSLGISWDEKIRKQNLSTILSSWDTAVCLHFRQTFKMPVDYLKMVSSDFFLCFYH